MKWTTSWLVTVTIVTLRFWRWGGEQNNRKFHCTSSYLILFSFRIVIENLTNLRFGNLVVHQNHHFPNQSTKAKPSIWVVQEVQSYCYGQRPHHRHSRLFLLRENIHCQKDIALLVARLVSIKSKMRWFYHAKCATSKSLSWFILAWDIKGHPPAVDEKWTTHRPPLAVDEKWTTQRH